MKKYPFSIDDWRWCVKNDFQIYLYPAPRKRYRIAVRRKGITTKGKDFIFQSGLKIESREMVGDVEFKDAREASDYVPFVYKKIREKYEQK
jgi:hypothetical protein